MARGSQGSRNSKDRKQGLWRDNGHDGGCAIGYVSGSSRARGDPTISTHLPEKAHRGFNLYSSGHGPEATLMDMEGRVLHRWRLPFSEAFPDFPPEWIYSGADFWRRGHVFENGDVLAIFEGLGLIKIDADSRLLWTNADFAHHDFAVLPNGDIVVLTRRPKAAPHLDPDANVLDDAVTVLAPDGTEKRRVSVLDALERSAYRDLWEPDGKWIFGDVLHTNAVAVLDGSIAERLPEFRRGNVLISMLVPNLIGVLDLDSGELVWALNGRFRRQHDPKILENGNLLLFDNSGARPHSRVLEFDPAEPDEIAWEYAGSEERPFRSKTCGTAERLPNGNTLITESDGGRAFEVTPAGETVWEFYNPHRAGEDGELIATLFELLRLPPGFDVRWARGDDSLPGPPAGNDDGD